MNGIVIVGGNGSGKTTLGRALAKSLGYKALDVEMYYFLDSTIPYAKARTKEEVEELLLADIQKYQTYVLSTVSGDFGTTINQTYDCIVYLDVPLEVRMKRIRARAVEKFGDRVMPGGDMYEQEEAFFHFVEKRDLTNVDTFIETMNCPVIRLDGTRPVEESVEEILRKSGKR